MPLKNFYNTILVLLLIATSPAALAQTAPVIVQAESGTRTTDTVLDLRTGGGVTYLTPTANFASPATAPQTASRIATYSVTFPAAGTYQLYVRVLVGAGAADDDSFFYGRGFGTKAATTPEDWVLINQIDNKGFTGASNVVTHEGTATTLVWKWLNVSSIGGGVSFVVPAGALTQTFQWGSREDGLDLDKFAFGLSSQVYTVSNLDNNTSTTNPPGPIAQGKPKFLGNIYSNPQLPNYTNNWNQVSPENAGKWGSVEGTRNVMNWSALDAAYNLAKSNNMPFRMHVLVWGNQQPAWIENLPAAEQLAEIREWFAAVAARYPDIDQVEVVNEPINDPPRKRDANDQGSGNYIEALGSNGTTGWDWILTSFRMARESFPRAKLLLNEYNLTSSSSRTLQYVGIINLLKAEGLIDAVGIQGHYFATGWVSSTNILNNLNTIAATGIPVYITEFDVDDRASNQTPASQAQADQYQLSEYQRIFPIFWEHPAVRGITLWGWRPGMWRTEQGAPLVYADGTERPALTWLRSYVAATVITALKENKQISFSLYPNPATNGRFTVEGTEKTTHIRVLDLNGKLLKERKVTNQPTVTLDLDVAPGLYLIQVTDGKNTSVRKLVVQ
ncbi:endo-1,4-beta-xylanase [Botryobacter ruber]|uniref:endo-1,4-beta-xylanase n=1 Tax=Botryobacter ruber TaxID=2171629 RepID=UPI0013E35EEC|nr:endo-1,4-beta-xylanase [Botryobacter ruber]